MSITHIKIDRRKFLASSLVGAVALGIPLTAQAKPSTGAADTEIHPFMFRASDEALADLRTRIRATKWPERETVQDATQGVNLATMQKLADYWLKQHDWRKAEKALNCRAAFSDLRRRQALHAELALALDDKGHRVMPL